LVGIEL
jgi:hypothetical protein